MVADRTGIVERRIRKHCTTGDVIPTPSGSSRFKVIDIGTSGIRVLAGDSVLPWVTWEVLEGVVPYLLSKDNVRIGADRKTTGKPGTLDAYFKDTLSPTVVSNYVAAILEKSGVVEYVHTRAQGVRLVI